MGLPPSSSPEGITVGPDKNLWFTDAGANQVDRITTPRTITKFTLPTANSAPAYLVTCSDGNLWSTEYSGNEIGRVSKTGVFKEFALPTSNSQPLGIAILLVYRPPFTEKRRSLNGRIGGKSM